MYQNINQEIQKRKINQLIQNTNLSMNQNTNPNIQKLNKAVKKVVKNRMKNHHVVLITFLEKPQRPTTTTTQKPQLQIKRNRNLNSRLLNHHFIQKNCQIEDFLLISL